MAGGQYGSPGFAGNPDGQSRPMPKPNPGGFGSSQQPGISTGRFGGPMLDPSTYDSPAPPPMAADVPPPAPPPASYSQPPQKPLPGPSSPPPPMDFEKQFGLNIPGGMGAAPGFPPPVAMAGGNMAPAMQGGPRLNDIMSMPKKKNMIGNSQGLGQGLGMGNSFRNGRQG